MKPAVQTAFIADVRTEGTGGNCMADVVTLKTGAVFIIADECIATYRSMQDWQDSGEGWIAIHEGGSFARCDVVDDDARSNGPQGRIFSDVGLTFVQDISTWESDGPVSVDLLHLPDGRVIGANGEVIVVYPSMEAFDAISETGACDESWPSLPLN